MPKLIPLILLIFTANLLFAQKTKLLTEPSISVDIFEQKYEKKIFASDEMPTNSVNSIRDNLYAIALINDLSKKFKLDIKLKSYIRIESDTIKDVYLKWGRKSYFFGKTSRELEHNDCVNATFNFYSAEFKKDMILNLSRMMDNEIILQSQFVTKKKKERFIIISTINRFTYYTKDLKTSKIMQYTYNLDDKVLSSEGELIPNIDKRDTIVKVDILTNKKRNQVTVKPGGFLRDGEWKFYDAKGLVRKVTYIRGKEQ